MAVDRIGDGLALRSKGDIVSHDGTNPYVLTAGTDGQILTAQSSAASGLVWTSLASSVTQYYEHIATASATTGVTSLSVSSIPSGYTDLQVYVVSSISSTGTNTDGQILFNSDTSTNYKNQYTYAGGTSSITLYGYELDYQLWLGSQNSKQYDSELINVSELKIFDYSSTSKWKQVSMICSSFSTSTSVQRFYGIGDCFWKSTDAITSITYKTTSSSTHNILAGSKMMVFGIKRYGQ